VYDISAMTAEDAEALLRGAGGEACVRLYRRADGRLLTADCVVGSRRRRRRRAVASVMGGGLLGAGAVLAFERTRPPPVLMEEPPAVMTGAVAYTEPPPPTTSTTTPGTPTVPPHVTGGAPRAFTPQDQLDAELAHVRGLLDKRDRASDPQGRRAVEVEIRAASQRVLQLSKPAGAAGAAGR